MNTTRITQAVLIADDLLAQYHRVIAQMNELGGGETLADDFSSLVGQANQVYAGVWEHLDEAATALEADGRGVHNYAQLRAEHGRLGILDSSSNTSLAVGASVVRGGITTQTTVSADANTVGAQHAQQMSALFKSLLPGFDWDAARHDADAPLPDISSSSGKHLAIAAAIAIAGLGAYLALT